MDARVQRTRNSIIDAFIQLRGKKPLEKITIRELSQLAGINKATFYLHFQDIYDLARQLETRVIQSILSEIRHPEYFLEQPSQFVLELHCAIMGQGAMLHILFPDNRNLVLADRLLEGIREYLRRLYPDREITLQQDVVLSYMVYGSFCAYILHQEHPQETLKTTAEISETIQRKYWAPV